MSKLKTDAALRSILDRMIRRTLRGMYPEEFDQLLKEYAVSDFRRKYQQAERKLKSLHPAEAKQLRDLYRVEMNMPKRKTGVPPKVCLLKRPEPKPAQRTYCDPFDALIMYERGWTLKEIAHHDGCTHRAVLAALVPQLAASRWFDPQAVAKRLNTWASQVREFAVADAQAA